MLPVAKKISPFVLPLFDFARGFFPSTFYWPIFADLLHFNATRSSFSAHSSHVLHVCDVSLI